MTAIILITLIKTITFFTLSFIAVSFFLSFSQLPLRISNDIYLPNTYDIYSRLPEISMLLVYYLMYDLKTVIVHLYFILKCQ